ncbi:MOSC domain-containing protein [Variovorax sp. YR752]|uniref:MOSC domain-containing protein n=1 Tax=Variovorax sp. YR752 TaxID=1884383 RepID=UPI0031382EA7
MTTPTALPIDALLVGPVALLPDGRSRSGIRKTATADALWLSPTGLQGDAQADLRVHGGVEKAVHHYPREHYASWASASRQRELLTRAGAFGENISTTGWDESTVCIGDVIQLGDARVQVSQGRQPCWKLDAHFGVPGMAREMQARGCTGWYYRVLEPGWVRAGALATRVERPHPEWPLSRLIALLFSRDARFVPEWEQAAALPALAERWRATFRKRLEAGRVEDWEPRLRAPASDT